MKNKIESFIKTTIDKYSFDGAVIGISGGIDSAVVGSLLVETLGKERVFGLLLPERDSASDTLEDSRFVCSFLGINYKLKPISKLLRAMGVYSLEPPALFVPRSIKEKYVKNKWRELPEEDTFIDDLQNSGNEEFRRGIAYYRAKHRARMCCLYLEAEKRNYAVVGTTNKSEFKTGFYVKWGDDSVDIEPIMHLYKTEVKQLARELNVPERIIEKSPSPDLIPGITDEFALGISYEDLDRILQKMESDPEGLSKENQNDVRRVKKIVETAQFRNIKNEMIEL